MSIYLNEKNPEKHKPFDDASQDIVEYVRYLEVIAGKSPNTAFSYYCDLRGFSRFMKRRRGLVPEDAEVVLAAAQGTALIFAAEDGAAEACLRISRRLRGDYIPLMKL